MIDTKEVARQMREAACKDENGNVVCSPELWEELASIIESAILPPEQYETCKLYDEEKDECRALNSMYCKDGFCKFHINKELAAEKKKRATEEMKERAGEK